MHVSYLKMVLNRKHIVTSKYLLSISMDLIVNLVGTTSKMYTMNSSQLNVELHLDGLEIVSFPGIKHSKKEASGVLLY